MGSEPLSAPSVTKDNMADLPGYCALTFTLMPVGSTSRRSVQVLGFTSMGPLTPPCRLYPLPVRQASALPAASSRFRLATGTLAVQLTLPLAGCVEDLHLQVSAPCRAHPRKRAKPLDFALSLHNLIGFQYSLKFTSIVILTGTGVLPSFIAGLNLYLRTASSAFSSKPMPSARITRGSCGFP